MSSIKNIAIVGSSGRSGTPMLTSLLATGDFNLTAISRSESTAVFPPHVTVLKGSYDSPSFLESALKDQDVLIITLATTASKDIQPKLIDAATAAGVKWILPNEYGPDSDPEVDDMNGAVRFLGAKKTVRDRIAKSSEGKSGFVAFCSGLWFDYSLGGGFFGIDIATRTAKLYDAGTIKLSTSTLAQLGLGVAALLSLPPSSLEKFHNGFVHV